MARSLAFVVLVIAIIASGALVARMPAQQPASIQTELLTEVRLLRQSIEMLAGSNARVQIVFGRLQLQEQRTEAAAKRIETAKQALYVFYLRANPHFDRLKEIEEELADTRLKPEQLDELRRELPIVKRATERLEPERAQLMQDQADAEMILNQEQGRWADLNRQLEELERALLTRQQ